MLLTLIPVHAPFYAVFAGPTGKPEFRLVVSLGLMEMSENKRLAAGFCIGDHIEPTDFKPNFVGFSPTDIVADWHDRCVEKRWDLIAKERDDKKPKIIVPENKGLALHA